VIIRHISYFSWWLRSRVLRWGGTWFVFRVQGGEIFGLVVSHLQYTEATLFSGEAILENLWTFKMILMCFELTSELHINFTKSCVIGINVSTPFLGVWVRWPPYLETNHLINLSMKLKLRKRKRNILILLMKV